MEFMKIVHMEMNNRHLKPKPGGYFSEKNSIMNAAQSPGAKTVATPATPKGGGDSGNENSSVRLSPAAELASERVWLVAQSEEVWLWAACRNAP